MYSFISNIFFNILGDNTINNFYSFDRCGWNIVRRYGILRIIFHMHSSDLKYLRKGQITNSSTFLQYYTAYISIVKYSELEFCWRKIDIYSFLCMFYCSHKNYFLSSKFHLLLGRSARSIWIFILLIYWSENH